MERLDRLIMQAEARRSAHFELADRHRKSLAEALRNAANAIEAQKVIDHQPAVGRG